MRRTLLLKERPVTPAGVHVKVLRYGYAKASPALPPLTSPLGTRLMRAGRSFF